MAATGYKSDPRAVTSVEGRTGAVDITLDDVGGTAAIDEAVEESVGPVVDAAITVHEGDTDPHGDRAFTTAAIATASASLVPNTRTVTAGTGLTGGGSLAADRTLAVSYGTSAGTAAQGNDSRLSDARTPTAHVHSGADITSGTVPIGQLPTGTSGSTVALGNHTHTGTYAPASHTHSGADITSGTVPVGQLPTGTSGTTVALGNHTHGVATGGTGLTSVTANSYVKGNGTGALVERTYAQVKTDLGLDAGAWTAPDSYAASMSNAGTPYYDVASRTEPNSVIRLRGRIAAGANYTSGATICTLNTSARPAAEVAFPVRVVGVGAANGSLTITTGGLVSYSANITVGTGTAWLLDGITYTLAA
ncbi:hypothetical protein Cme02nite_38210 [Catellatospora methionotrophica]|uniref:Uncharacterized protein n=1 Tax=Catellatospora methionotrophica TaxID=121620 RepID=A0A8J3LH73_9ACTN|nr:hypothetical protein [Catellatospora methionotrophica]GIG15489.1 hypothetical protein Cme02nite_38210 [Catellatospora methionotrophica]